MTGRREAFAVAVAQGMTQADALRAAYPKAARWTSKAVYSRATRLAHLPEVAARIEELRSGEGEAAAVCLVDDGREPVPAPVADEDADAAGRDRLARILAWVEAQGVSSYREARVVALQADGGTVTGWEAAAVADAWMGGKEPRTRLECARMPLERAGRAVAGCRRGIAARKRPARF